MTLESAIQDWLLQIISTEKPSNDVIAYNIGVFETENGYSLYLIGASDFSEEDSDWACEETFTPKERYLLLPASDFKLGKWEAALKKIVKAVKACLKMS